MNSVPIKFRQNDTLCGIKTYPRRDSTATIASTNIAKAKTQTTPLAYITTVVATSVDHLQSIENTYPINMVRRKRQGMILAKIQVMLMKMFDIPHVHVRARFHETRNVRTRPERDSDSRVFFAWVFPIGCDLIPDSHLPRNLSRKSIMWQSIFVRADEHSGDDTKRNVTWLHGVG